MKTRVRLGVLTVGTAAVIGVGATGVTAGERAPEPTCPVKSVKEAQEKTVHELLPCGPPAKQAEVMKNPLYVTYKDTKVKDLPLVDKTLYEFGLRALGLPPG